MRDQNSNSDTTESDDAIRLSFYATPEHKCSYLPDKQAVTLFADPHADLDNHIYSVLSQYGFRRSGKHIYRPACPTCAACIPIRISAADFTVKRSHKRIRNLNRDLEIKLVSPEFREEQHKLYCKYIHYRHPNGGMDDPNPERYMEFLTSEWSITRFAEFRLDGKLLAVAVMDMLEDGISAVYTYFDPDYDKRSLGTLAILWEIEWVKQQNLPWLYLGYWIEECAKMRYKSQFLPHQKFIQGNWV